MRGTFIVLEGPDGSGTTRQSEALSESLKAEGRSVLLTAEPTSSPLGQQIRQMLHAETLPSPDAIQLLFCADRAQHVATVIEPALRRGEIVVCDRYTLSTIVYGGAFGLDRQWLQSINAVFPKPDLTLVTLPPFDVCIERMARREKLDKFETENLQRRVYEGYKSVEDPHAIFIDTSGEKPDVAAFVLQQVHSFFDQREKAFHGL